MSDTAFNADLDALVRGQVPDQLDELTRFAAEIYREESSVTMPTSLKMQLAVDLGLVQAQPSTPTAAPVSRRSLRSMENQRRSRRPWLTALALVAALVLALTGILRWGVPNGSDDGNDSRLFLSSPAVPTVSATPRAESSQESWMQEITPDQCTTTDNGQVVPSNADDLEGVQRGGYQVIGPADPNEVLVANEAVRQYVACEHPASLMTEPFAMETSVQEAGFSPYQVGLNHRQLNHGMAVSAQMTGLGFSEDDMHVVPAGLDSGSAWPNPEAAFAMEDGRLVIPMGAFDYPNALVGSGIVLTEEGGTWLIDDVIPLCFGDCDGVYAELLQIALEYIWLQPIDAEECDRNAVVPDGLSNDEIAAIRSRQYRACEMRGDEAPLQGPGYQLTEGEDAQPVSEEIETLHRADGETAGSLQRIQYSAPATSGTEQPSTPWTAFQPNSVVTLADGRIAVLESTVRSGDASTTSTGRTNPVITSALVWQAGGDELLLDQEVTVCLGNCDAYWGADAETPTPTPMAMILPETCDADAAFQPDFTSHARIAVRLRPGAGIASGVTVATLPPNSPLQYLCEQQPTTNPSGDRMEEDQVWLLVRTEDGTEGWIREIDVQPGG